MSRQKNFIEFIDYSSSMVDRRNFSGSKLLQGRGYANGVKEDFGLLVAATMGTAAIVQHNLTLKTARIL